MIVNRLIKSAVQSALAQGVVMSVQNMPEDKPATPPEMPMVPLSEIEIDKYKTPFFFVTGVLVGAAFGLRYAKVVVVK